MVIFAFAGAKLVQTIRKNKFIYNFMSIRRNITSRIVFYFLFSHHKLFERLLQRERRKDVNLHSFKYNIKNIPN